MRYYILLFYFTIGSHLNTQKLQAQFYAPNFIGQFEADLAETSALIYFDSCLWSINDGGNQAQIFQFHAPIFPITKQKIKTKAIPLSPAINRDWEALAQSESQVFIGDFGNNSGRRRDLCIYILDKSALRKSLPPLVDSLRFRYSDQVDFAPPSQAHNFDCEAFVYTRDTLHLFTKNWTNQRTRHYTLAIKPNQNNKQTEQVAVFRREFDTRFLVTDAALDSSQRHLLLVGYNHKNGTCEATLFSLDFPNQDFSNQNFPNQDFSNQDFSTDFLAAPVRRIPLPHAIQLGQLEGATFTHSLRGYLSAEAFGRGKFKTAPQLFSFDFADFISQPKKKTKKKLKHKPENKLNKPSRFGLRFFRLIFSALVGLIPH